MLNVLRDNFKHKPYLKWVLGFVAVCMVGYLGVYFTDSGGAAGGGWAARVNGVEITERQFRQEARATDRYYRQILGSNYDQFRQNVQIGQQAIQRLIEQQLILQDAKKLGLKNTREELAEAIRTSENFQDPDTGRFIGSERYQELVEGAFGSVATYERSLANQIIEQRWTGLVTQGVNVSDRELEETFRRRTEKTGISYVVVTSEGRQFDGTVTDQQARTWYDAHPDDYAVGERRKIRYVVIDREAQRATVSVTDGQVRNYYDTNQTDYAHDEQRRARHILIRVAPQAGDDEKQQARKTAEEALERLRGGEDFATLAGELSDDTNSAAQGGDLGFFERGQMVKPFEDAAFVTAPGEFTPVVESPFGFHVIEVTDSRPAGTSPLDQVAATIRRTLEEEAAQTAVLDAAVRLRDEMGNAEGFDRLAAGQGLKIESRTLSASDRLFDIGASPEFSVVVTGLGPGEVSQPLRVAAGYALAIVDEVLPPDRAPLEDVRDEVDAAILEDRGKQAALRAAREALDGSGDFAAMAASLKLEVQTAAELGPGQPVTGAGGNAPEVEKELFGADVNVGDRSVVAVPAGALLYEVTDRRPFDPVEFEAQRATLRNEALLQKRSRYRQSLVARLQDAQRVEINYSMLDRVQ